MPLSVANPSYDLPKTPCTVIGLKISPTAAGFASRSLSEIEFLERRINNLRVLQELQVVNSG